MIGITSDVAETLIGEMSELYEWLDLGAARLVRGLHTNMGHIAIIHSDSDTSAVIHF